MFSITVVQTLYSDIVKDIPYSYIFYDKLIFAEAVLMEKLTT